MPSSRERHKGLIGRGHDLRRLCRVYSGLVQTYQPPKGKKCEILNLELGKVV